MTRSALYLICTLSVLAVGCNAFSGIEEFNVGMAPEGPSDAGSEAEVGAEVHESGLALDGDASEVDAGGAEAADSGGAEDGDGDVAPEVLPPTQKRVFVTSESYAADLGGLAGADAKCQKLADAAKLGGTYRAWLSDSTISAKSRLTHSMVPYRLVDGALVALNWDDLTSGSIAHAIDRTESAKVIASSLCNVWTNTLSDGSRYVDGSPPFTCSDWTSGVGSSIRHFSMGRTDKADGWWATACTSTACDGVTASLYCFEQ